MIRVILAMLTLLICGCGVTAPNDANVLVMGDSLLAVNRLSGKDVGSALEQKLGTPVINRSIVGAGYYLPISVPAQFRDNGYDWVVLNGGGNDILFGCGCNGCGPMIDRLFSSDGRSGAIPATVARIRATGARVVYVGYLRSNGFDSPVEHCGPTGDEMDRRAERMAALDPNVIFISLADLVPSGEESYMSKDRMHPSPIGSDAIAERIKTVMMQTPKN
ncbi:SGNH/GDSL hydrolase family protein [Pseudothioclava nitratireducens]|jgi:lysophospholipase L1-like esterase|uniref:SGNH/GDSL hydrolase family protein n=1 Tax=Pseudothioclava nitratireducens TaxID=1928646 RepID=UPI0023DB237C|nr:SGNH/GDSL hydrolase family protein [Defluviimonas nitratireducens]MDF1621068.1 SGNH/GDSL hydrolase family protein [Defluviimonas nitratireducens]